MQEAWSTLLRPVVGLSPSTGPADECQVRTPSSVGEARAENLPREIPAYAAFRPVSDSPLWQCHSKSTQPLVCFDTGGFDIELAHPLYPQYVVGSATDRVWVYHRHRRVKFNSDPTVLGSAAPEEHRAALDALSVASGSTHDKVLLHDPPLNCQPHQPPNKSNSRGSLIRRERCIRRRFPTLTRSVPELEPGLSSGVSTSGMGSGVSQSGHPLTRSVPNIVPPRSHARKYYYVGETLNGRRHGWGRLVTDERIVYEGCWLHGRALGYYIAYHEFHVEMGFQTAWHRVAVFVLGDAHASVVPVALDRHPILLRQEQRQNALLQRSECLPGPDESLSLSHGDCRKIPHNMIAPNLWFSQTSTISKSFDWEKSGFDNASQISATSEFLPRKRFQRMPTRGDPLDLSRCSSNESTDSSPSVIELGRSMSLARSNSYSCKASSTDAGSTADYSAAARLTKERTPKFWTPITRTCPCRRGSFPSAVPAQSFMLSEPSLASLSSPGGLRECPIASRVDTRWHRRVIASLHHAAPGTFHAADFANWTNAHLVLFLAATGAYHAVDPFRRHKLHGNTVQHLDMAALRKLGINDDYTKRFIISAFRYLWNGVDWGDPLAPQIHKQAHPNAIRLPCLDSEDISLIRRLGAGGHALVFQGHINRGPPVALKVFVGTRNRRAVRVPVSNRICKAEENDNHAQTPSRLGLSLNRKFALANQQPVAIIAGIEELSAAETEKPGTDRTSLDESPSQTGRMSMSPLQVFATVKGWFGLASAEAEIAHNVPAIKVAAVETPPELPGDRPNWSRSDNSKSRMEDDRKTVLQIRKSIALRMRDHEIAMMEILPSHPNICGALGYFALPTDLPGLALNLCPHGAMDARVGQEPCRSPHASKAKLQWPQIVEMFEHVAVGMAEIHNAGVLHRDIKPSNFLIAQDERAKFVPQISDFGMAKSHRAGNPTPGFLAAYGNIYYAAPEVLRGEGFWPESDVFSYGVSFWEALTGRPAHEGLTRGQIFCMVATGMAHYRPPPLLCPSLSLLLSRTVAFDRRERPTFREIAATISALNKEKSADALSTVRAFMGI